MVRRLREIREANNMSLRRLGVLSDVEFSKISYFERGKGNLKLSEIEKLAETLNVTPAYLVGWSDDVQVVTEVRKVYTHQPTVFAPEHRPNREGRVIKWVNNQRSRLRERRG